MQDSKKSRSVHAALLARIVDLEQQLVLRNGQCAQAVVALIEIGRLAEQIGNDPATAEQTVMGAVRMRWCASSVVRLFADERGIPGSRRNPARGTRYRAADAGGGRASPRRGALMDRTYCRP